MIKEPLTFSAEKHEYREGGCLIPSVTQVLKAEGLWDFSMVKKEYLDYALVLGTAVHRGSELYELGTLDETTVDPIVKKRLDQWLLFLESAEKKGWLQGEGFIEKRLSSGLGYAGCPDRFYYCEKRLITIDIKTGIKTPGTHLQTAAYEILEREYLLSQKKQVRESLRFCVYLKDDSFELVEHKDVFDSANFRSLLNVYNYKKKWNLY